MTAALPPSQRGGRVLALVGIVLVASNLRTAVAALSPIFTDIGVDIPLTSLDVGIIGTLPPLCFALFGLLAPVFQRSLRVESLLIIALAAMIVGDVLRALSASYPMLVLASALTFAGMGIGNVLLPPLVKKYFPDRIGPLTALYATVMALFALLPPLVAVQVSEGAGWRFSVGMWGILGVLAIVPWVRLLGADRRRTPDPSIVEGVVPEPDAAMLGRARHSALAWSLGLMFGVTALNTYACFAWLPEILTDIAGLDQGGAGAMLSLYTSMGIPASLLIPVIATRVKSVSGIILFGIAAFIAGYLGLLLAPTAALGVWVALAGIGPLLFPLALLLINRRSRTQRGAVALSGFAQGFGYLLGALGPLVVGVLHQLSGGWTAPLLFLLVSVASVLLVVRVVSRPRFIEDDWHRAPRTV
ncbi:MFS transporter [Subtercola boreus]|uniref:MFS transporter n=1 Tax=Subtercola boreus TaxID=120213 RepID=A0A3E0VHY1_9MICO|nr:MFS transporter [Subtercola boreus]RFA09554.1 MFS transporter [Subtercola boreus]TQL53374.1 CP family cyanate transporter-like MFS transporter [Subtercola boreus]